MENKIIFVIIILLESIMSVETNAQNNKATPKKLNIDIATIDYIEVSAFKTNKKKPKVKRIAKSQWLDFVSNWNNSKKMVNCPANYTTKVYIYYTDLTRRIFDINSSIISDSKICIETSDPKLADRLLKGK